MQFLGRVRRHYVAAVFLAFAGLSAAHAQENFVLISDVPSNQPVGTTITFSVVGPATDYDYALSIGNAGERPRPVYGFTIRRQFQWTPQREGDYNIIATVRNLITKEKTTLARKFFIRPVATDGPVVSTTRNPLVALYSAPPCIAARVMRVSFVSVNGGDRFTTSPKPCDSNKTMNFFVAGMLPETTYRMRHAVINPGGGIVSQGPVLEFTTGAPEVELPDIAVRVPPMPEASLFEPILLAGPTFGSSGPFATDMNGNIVWYYENPVETQIDFLLTRILPGGTMLMVARTADADRFRLRQIDLAGNTIRETTVRWLTEQYLNLGGTDVIPALHHEARLLPNGQFVVLGTIERLLEDVQGEGIVDVIGDIVLSLDQEWNVTWAWNAFDHMDVTREAILGETCVSQGPGCPILIYADEANDWLHANAIGYSPADGNLVLSIRHQDWVTKIDYQDGVGSGAVVWNLGNEGDLTLTAGDPNLWFSHQHDSNYIDADTLLLYDNGNGTPFCLADENDCLSRGQLYRIDENAMTAELIENFDLQNYSRAVGAAQRLVNGNYAFNSGIVDGGSTARSDEIGPDGSIVFSLEMDSRIYRSFRLRDLYSPPPLAQSE